MPARIHSARGVRFDREPPLLALDDDGPRVVPSSGPGAGQLGWSPPPKKEKEGESDRRKQGACRSSLEGGHLRDNTVGQPR